MPNGRHGGSLNGMATNNRSDEVPTEQAPKDGPLTQLVDERLNVPPDDLRTDLESSGPGDIHQTAPKEYAEGTAEHDDDREP